MEKKHFLYKLYPLSPTFYSDQNVEEKRIMQQHTQYWMELKDKTKIIVYGSVFAPKGVYGMVVIEVESDEEEDEQEEADQEDADDDYCGSLLCWGLC